MPETFANDAAGALSAGINASVTSLALGTGEGAKFPTTGNFRIVIDSEIIIVGTRSGDTLSSLTRGAEGTTAASHSSGAAVTAAVTAGALNAIGHAVPWTLIQEITLGSAGTFTFSSIPSTHGTLMLDIRTKCASEEVWMRFNSHATDYLWYQLAGATRTSGFTQTAAKIGRTTTTTGDGGDYPFGELAVRIQDYLSTTRRKMVSGLWANQNDIGHNVGIWSPGTAQAITSIVLASDTAMTGTFAAGSVARLYGLPV